MNRFRAFNRYTAIEMEGDFLAQRERWAANQMDLQRGAFDPFNGRDFALEDSESGGEHGRGYP